MTRRGILQISKPLLGRAKACLPPKHKILAIKSGLHTDDWLIEGPMMPPCSDGFEPERVVWTFAVDWVDHVALTLSAEFRLANWNDRMLGEWTIGTWPNADAYQDWLIDQG